VRALPGYREAVDAAAECDAWLKTQPPVPTVDPALAADITDEWVTAARAYETGLAEYESKRKIVQRRRQEEANRAQSIFGTGIDLIFGALQANLTRLLAEVAAIAPELAGATTAEQAIAADAGAAWKQLTELAGEYHDIRTAQTFVLLKAPYELWKSCTPATTGENADHANLAFIRNIDTLWPDWRRPGLRMQRITLGDGSTPRREEPWPADEYGPAMLVWLHTSDAQPWLPTTKQLRELRTEPTNIGDELEEGAEIPHLTEPSEPYKSLMIGPTQKRHTLNQPPQSSHRGRPVTEAERASRAAQFAELQGAAHE
jgi:hypothetical protein